MEWFYAKNNQQLGPVTFEVLGAMLQRGELQPGDLVWRDGMPSWIPASTVPELAPIFSNASANSSIGYYNPVAAVNAAHSGQIIYAGFWLRFVAYIIDEILLMVVGYIIGAIVGLLASPMAHQAQQPNTFLMSVAGANALLGMAINWLYYSMMESSKYQGTLGKLAMGLAVTDMNGRRIGFGKATGRYFGKIISGLIFLIGYMMAGWTQQKQALHDIMAGCLVIRKR